MFFLLFALSTRVNALVERKKCWLLKLSMLV